MKNFKPVTLEIPNQIEYIEIATSALESFAQMLGFSHIDCSKAMVGFEEVITNIIKHAYPENDEGTIKITLEDTELGLRIRVLDDGAPIDSEKFHALNLNVLPDELPSSGLGQLLIQRLFEKSAFETIGQGGNLTTLEKHVRASTHLHPNDKQMESEEPAKPTEKINYTVRLFEPKDALGVSKLAYIAYHHTYPFEHIYIPAKVKEMNKTGNLVSAVAGLDDGGEIISHSALELSGHSSGIAEIGVAFTNPAYRGHGTINHIWDFLLNDVAVARNLKAVYASCVTAHPFSQKAALKFGMAESALMLAVTEGLAFKKIKQIGTQRESLLITTKVYDTTNVETLYLPQRHQQIIATIFYQLGVKTILRKPGQQNVAPFIARSSLRIFKMPGINITKIYVDNYGSDFYESIAKEHKALCVERIESIYIHLNLNHPWSPQASNLLEDMGYVFCGIMPADNNYQLVLQFLNNQFIDFSHIVAYSEMGKRLIKYIEKCST